jgi:hypothetical protein
MPSTTYGTPRVGTRMYLVRREFDGRRREVLLQMTRIRAAALPDPVNLVLGLQTWSSWTSYGALIGRHAGRGSQAIKTVMDGASVTGDPGLRDAPPLSARAISDAPPELLDPVVRLLRIAGHAEDMRVLAPAYQREILWRLLTGEQGALVRQICLANGNLVQVSRATRPR